MYSVLCIIAGHAFVCQGLQSSACSTSQVSLTLSKSPVLACPYLSQTVDLSALVQMRRRREYSRMRSDEVKAEAGATQAGVPAPDIPLQPTFDADNNSHRYRYMEPLPDAALCRYNCSYA